LNIALSSHVRESYLTEGSQTRKLSYRDLWDQPALIEASLCEHTNGCVPYRANRVAVTQAAGTYVSKLPTRAIYTMYNYVDQGIKLTHQLIQAVIWPLWPKHKPITGKDRFNVLVKLLRAKKHYNTTDKDYESFIYVVNDSELLLGIDDQTALEDDEVYELACVICKEALVTTENLEDAIFSFLEYLDLLADRAKGFSYKVLYQK